jgi:glutamyl/glutaminyl-tRNA synthetase
MELRDMLKRNVEEAKRKEQEKRERKYQERLEELKEVIEGIEKDMMEASLKGETSIVVIRIDTLEQKSHVEDLKRYFIEKGFNVKVKSQTFFNYAFCIGVFDLDTSIKHKMIISWEE